MFRQLSLPQKNASIYLYLFIMVHTLLWTIGPSLTRLSVPHDTLESITWGLQWQLGYHKHPFLTAWLCAAVSELFGTVGWPVYLLAQLSVATTFIAVWALAKKILPVAQALIATLVLEGVLFYNINSFNLTPDTLQSPLWALLSLFLYQAITSQKTRYWLLSGFFAALCLCTKYQAAVLFMPLMILCLWSPLARLSFRKPGIYIAVLTLLLSMSPHLYWLYQHDFITFIYAEQVSSEYTTSNTPFNHLSYPFGFLLNAFIELMGLLLLLWPFYRGKRVSLDLSLFQKHFLYAISFGPLLLSLSLCALSGDYFPPRWLTPYFFSYGILAMVYLRPHLNKKNIEQFTITLIAFSTLLFLTRMMSLTLFPRAESDSFLPDKEIALTLEQLWTSRYHKPMPYIAGSGYLISAILPYMRHHPTPYLNWNPKESPWISERDIHQKGGLFVWDEAGYYTWDKSSKNNLTLSTRLLKRFPKLIALPHFIFYRASDKKPITIGIAILPPEQG